MMRMQEFWIEGNCIQTKILERLEGEKKNDYRAFPEFFVSITKKKLMKLNKNIWSMLWIWLLLKLVYTQH